MYMINKRQSNIYCKNNLNQYFYKVSTCLSLWIIWCLALSRVCLWCWYKYTNIPFTWV